MIAEAQDTYRKAESALFAEYNVEPQEHWVDIPAQRTAVRVLEVGCGAPIVLVHGSPNDAAAWIPLVAQLKDYRCLMVERPGSGLSAPVDRWHDHMAESASIVATVADHLSLDVIDVVGSSLGGLYAYNFALAYPGRLGKLIQMGSPAGPAILGLPPIFRFLSLPVPSARIKKALSPSPEKAPGMFKQIGHGRSIAAGIIPDVVFDWYSALLRNTDTAVNLLGEVRAIASPLGYRSSAKLTSVQLANLRPPTLYLWGDDDAFSTPAKADALCAFTPGAAIEHFEGFGHLLWYDDPGAVAARVRAFLSGGGEV